MILVDFRVLLYSTSMVGFVRVTCGEIEIDLVAYDLFLVIFLHKSFCIKLVWVALLILRWLPLGSVPF